MSGKVVLSRARAAGLTSRQAAAKRMKLRAKTFTLTAAAKTRVRIAVPRRLARKILGRPEAAPPREREPHRHRVEPGRQLAHGPAP